VRSGRAKDGEVAPRLQALSVFSQAFLGRHRDEMADTVIEAHTSMRFCGLEHAVGHPGCPWTKQKHLSNGAFEPLGSHPVWPKGADTVAQG